MSTMHTQPTPGPWEAETPNPLRGAWQVRSGDYFTGSLVAVMNPRHDADEVAANAHLIAAAPELLKALKYAVDWLNVAGIHETLPVQQQARAAIAKATGEQQ